MKIKFKNFLKLYENPDNVYTLSYQSLDVITFGYIDNNMLISKIGSKLTHQHLIWSYKNECNPIKYTRTYMKYPGRIWLNHKLISFWEYPKTKDELFEIISDIEKEYNDCDVYEEIYLDLSYDDFIKCENTGSHKSYDFKYENNKIYLNNNEVEYVYIKNSNNVTKDDFMKGVKDYYENEKEFYCTFFVKYKQKELKLNILNNIDDWRIEIINEKTKDKDNFIDINMDWKNRYESSIIFLKDYVGSGKRSEEELKKDHNKIGSGGKTDGYGSELKSKRNPIEWEQAKRTSESVQFTYNNKLNSNFWHNDLFDERLRQKLITIATEFFDGLNYDVQINDITLTGSLANFNYNKYSDLDVHVIIDYSKIDKNVELVKKSIDGYRFMWNLRHNIKIKGHDVELYIQDVNEPHTASGLYSLKYGKWITKPKHNEPTINENEVNFKYLTYKSGIEMLEDISKKEMSSETAMKNHLFASEYKRKIHQARKDDLSNDGEFSVGNLVFKKLRNSGDFKKLIDIIEIFYDKIYSQN